MLCFLNEKLGLFVPEIGFRGLASGSNMQVASPGCRHPMEFFNSIKKVDNDLITDTIKNKKLTVEAILVDENSELIADSIKALSNNFDAVYSAKNQYNLVPSVNILTDNITLKVIFVVPMIILFVGYVVWRYRKNKK